LNKAQRHGRIAPDNFTPYPQNQLLARFFVNIGRGKLSSGARDLSRYTKIYSQWITNMKQESIQANQKEESNVLEAGGERKSRRYRLAKKV
jgi:hypothetical protein